MMVRGASVCTTKRGSSPSATSLRIGGPVGSGAVNAFLIRSIDTGSVASASADDAVDVVDAGCEVAAAVCPADATADEQMTLIVNSDSRIGAVFVMAVTSIREPLQAEGALIVAPGGPSCKSGPPVPAIPD